jgi:hypothetical protein
MPDWMIVVVGAAAYFAVMKWLLPRFGVST